MEDSRGCLGSEKRGCSGHKRGGNGLVYRGGRNEEWGAPFWAGVRSRGSSGRAPGGQGRRSGQIPPC